jgi:hypothetical protein
MSYSSQETKYNQRQKMYLEHIQDNIKNLRHPRYNSETKRLTDATIYQKYGIERPDDLEYLVDNHGIKIKLRNDDKEISIGHWKTLHDTKVENKPFYFKPFLFENAHSGAFSSGESDFTTCIFNARRCNKRKKKSNTKTKPNVSFLSRLTKRLTSKRGGKRRKTIRRK